MRTAPLSCNVGSMKRSSVITAAIAGATGTLVLGVGIGLAVGEVEVTVGGNSAPVEETKTCEQWATTEPDSLTEGDASVLCGIDWGGETPPEGDITRDEFYAWVSWSTDVLERGNARLHDHLYGN